MAGWSYRGAGVDIDKGDAFVERIKPLIKGTRSAFTLSELGGFAGLCGLPADIKEPLLVSSTDGVGTKLKIACLLGIHDTVGIDLVAMSVNDIATSGARPLFFLDYLATSKLEVDQAYQVVKGIAEGCRIAGCALIGGETAEMPDFYAPGEYDLAGFAVGVVERSRVIDFNTVKAGDVVIGVASSGLHSNGYSLARKVLLDHGGFRLDQRFSELKETLGLELLRPTRIYTDTVARACSAGDVHALCHITGGGLPGNLSRIVPQGLALVLNQASWDVPHIFQLIAHTGHVEPEEMLRTFNMGIGFVVIASASHAGAIVSAINDKNDTAMIIGEVITCTDAPSVRFV